MTKAEVQNFIKKIKVYYPYFSLDGKDVVDEWAERLKPYENEDVLRKLEEHLKGEKAEEPPKLHFITKYLKTKEEKERMGKDYLIRCNLCNKEMYLSDYDKFHYDKCLMIYTLIPILRKNGEEVDYDILDAYDLRTLEKVLYKYLPLKKDLKEIL